MNTSSHPRFFWSALLVGPLGLFGCSQHADSAAPIADTGTLEVGGDAVDEVAIEASPDAPSDGREEAILSAKWKKLAGAPTIAGKQDDVYFVDSSNGFSVNGNGQIWGSTDGGAKWSKLLDQPGTYFRAISFFDPKHGFAANIGTDYYPGVTDTNPLYETIDGGATWKVKAVDGAAPPGICGFWRIDDKNIVATGRVGGPSFFLKSTDAGATWKSTDISSKIAMLVDAYFPTPTVGVVTGGTSTGSGSRCAILRTEDGGASWANVFTSKQAGEMCWKVSFPTPNVGYAAVLTFGAKTPSSFIKTTDGGKTWQELPFIDGSYAGLGVGFITENIGWIGGEASGKPAQRTKDGGATWEADPSLGSYINRFRFVDGKTGYAIGTTIYKLEIP